METEVCRRFLSVAVGLLADGFLGTDGHLTEIVIGTIVDVEVHIALDARQTASIRMLPELPLTLVLEGVDIIVGNPVGILVENGVVKVARLKFEIGIE